MADELATSDVSAPDSGSAAASPVAPDSSSGQGATTPSTGTSAAAVNLQSSDPTNQTQTEGQPEQDIFAGIPSLAELEAQKAKGIPYAAGLHQLRSTLEPLSAQHKELSAKYQPFEQFTQTPEELQSVVKLNESLNRYAPDAQGVLRPDPTEFVQHISTEDPVRADHLTSALVWGTTTHPVTRQPVTRAELILEVIAKDPEFRVHALKTLGGVEPSAVPAPTWAPDPEELSVIKPELQDLYRKLPFDKRATLKLNDPDFINEYLEDQKFKGEMRERGEREEVQRREYAEQQAQRVETEANNAGEQAVETGFREALTSIANHLYETYKPTDDPVTNKREGAHVALALTALSHPDTRWAAEAMLKEMGITQQDLDALNQSREAYANGTRQHGYLAHKKMRTTGEDPSRLQQRMIVQAKNLATKIIGGRNEYFTKRAQSHNNNLDQTERARVPIGGQAQAAGNGSTGNRYLDAGKRTEAEIWGTH